MMYVFKYGSNKYDSIDNRQFAIEFLRIGKKFGVELVKVIPNTKDDKRYELIITENVIVYDNVFDYYYRPMYVIQNCTLEQVRTAYRIRHKYYNIRVKEYTPCGLE